MQNIVVWGHDRKYQLLDLAECLEQSDTCSTQASAEAVREAVNRCIKAFKAEGFVREGIFRFAADTYSFHSRAFLKIQEGCDHKCAYCRVRLARGPSVSLGPEEVASRAAQLYHHGYREIVLTGVNLTAYRDPQNSYYKLPQLIDELTEGSEGYRIRLSSLEPEMVRSDLLKSVSSPGVCPHFHIPVQSGSDRILKSVYRPYNADRIREGVDGLRRAKDDPFIAADVIVGLPGESDEEFQATYNLLHECEFAALHIFTFSPRPGTELYQAENHVPERVAGERADKLRELADDLKMRYERRWIGRIVNVLIEEQKNIDGREYLSGLSENYLRIDIPLTEFEQTFNRSYLRGEIVSARINTIGKNRIIGTLMYNGKI